MVAFLRNLLILPNNPLLTDILQNADGLADYWQSNPRSRLEEFGFNQEPLRIPKRLTHTEVGDGVDLMVATTSFDFQPRAPIFKSGVVPYFLNGLIASKSQKVEKGFFQKHAANLWDSGHLETTGILPVTQVAASKADFAPTFRVDGPWILPAHAANLPPAAAVKHCVGRH